MNKKNTEAPSARMKARDEHPVLCMRREEGSAVFRYQVAVSNTSPKSYSIYAEYEDGERYTVGEVPDFSTDRDMAESFCSMLERFGVTPLSLNAVYEDTYTP